MAFSSMVLRQLLLNAERIGIASSPLLAGVLERTSLAGENVWVCDRDMFEIVDRALSASETSALGLRLGAIGSLNSSDPLGLHCSVAESFQQVLRALVHFGRLAHDQGRSCLKETRTTLTLEFAALDGPDQFQHCMKEFIASNLATLLTRFAGPSARLTRLLFNHPAPAHVAAYEAAFGCELRFNQPRFSLVVDATVAAHVQTLSQPALAERLWQLAEQQLIQTSRGRTILDDVRDSLRVDWGARTPPSAAMARRLGLSERSLRRRLAELNVDYRSLVAERHQEIASQMLRREGVSVKQVAHALGYYSPSAFHRAFKRWTGASPTEHRLTHH